MSAFSSSNVALLVTTQQAYAKSGLGKWMTLGDYQNKEDFTKTAKAFCIKSLECDGDLYFVDVQPDFNIDGLITKTDIDSSVWEFIALDDTDDIKMVQAYISCYQIDGNIKQTLKTANKVFYGHFSNAAELGREYRHDLNVTPTTTDRGIFEGLDITCLSNNDMAVQLMKHMSECDGYYFWDTNTFI